MRRKIKIQEVDPVFFFPLLFSSIHYRSHKCIATFLAFFLLYIILGTRSGSTQEYSNSPISSIIIFLDGVGDKPVELFLYLINIEHHNGLFVF